MASKLFLPLQKSDYENNAKILPHLAAMYKNTFTNMLETLLIEVNRDISSPKDSQVLYKKIILSMVKMAEFNLIINGVWNPILLDSQMLEVALEDSLSDKAFSSYIKKEDINIQLFLSYITKLNKYYINFNEKFPNNKYFLADKWSARSRWPPDEN